MHAFQLTGRSQPVTSNGFGIWEFDRIFSEKGLDAPPLMSLLIKPPVDKEQDVKAATQQGAEASSRLAEQTSFHLLTNKEYIMSIMLYSDNISACELCLETQVWDMNSEWTCELAKTLTFLTDDHAKIMANILSN